MQDLIEGFLSGDSFAVVGASTNRAKFGNKVLRHYMDRGLTVFPVNPLATDVEGLAAFASLSDLPEPVHGVSIVTPPAITEQVVAEAAELGIRHIWMQPGAESSAAVALGEEKGLSVIAGGPCLLIELP
jgi:predicted CoA-binding protein